MPPPAQPGPPHIGRSSPQPPLAADATARKAPDFESPVGWGAVGSFLAFLYFPAWMPSGVMWPG